MFHTVVYEKLLKMEIRNIKRIVRRLKNYQKRVEHRDSADEKLLLESWELKSVFPLMALAQKVCVLRKASHLHKLKGHQGN